MRRHSIHRLIRIVSILIAVSLHAQTPQEQVDFAYGIRLFDDGLYRMAAIQFIHFIDVFPHHPKAAEAQLRAGECYFILGSYEEAQGAFIELMLRYPNAPFLDQAQFRIAECFENIGKKEEAAESFGRVKGVNPDGTWALRGELRKAEILIELDRFTEAENHLRSFIEASPAGAYRGEALLLLSSVVAAQGSHESAIRILESIVDRPVQESDISEALYRIGVYFEHLGRWKESGERYDRIIRIDADSSMKQRAWYRRGECFRLENDDENALTAYRNAVEAGSDASVIAMAHFSIAELLKDRGDMEGALTAFDSSERAAFGSPFLPRVQFEKASILRDLGRHKEAAEFLLGTGADAPSQGDVSGMITLLLADILCDTGDYVSADEAYRSYLDRFPEDDLANLVRLRRGKLVLDKLKSWDEGFAILRQLWQSHAGNRIVPEARFVYAEGLERAGRTVESLQNYRWISLQYPGSSWAEKARERAQRLERKYPVHLDAVQSEITQLITRAVANPEDKKVLFDLGKIFLEDIKRYDDAVRYFERHLEAGADETDRTLFYLARTYEEINARESNPGALDEAKALYRRLFSEYPGSRHATEAEWSWIRLASGDSSAVVYRRGQDLIRKTNSDDWSDEMRFQFAQAAVEIDSLEKAAAIFDTLLRSEPHAHLDEELLYTMSGLVYRLDDRSRADSLLDAYTERYPRGRYAPQVLYERAGLAMESNRLEEAETFLVELMRKFRYSPWADSGSIRLGRLALSQARFADAVDAFMSAMEVDSVWNLAASVGLREDVKTSDPHLLLDLARAYEGLEDYARSKAFFLKAEKMLRSQNRRLEIYQALSRISEKEDRDDRAAEYLRMAMEESPTDSTAEMLGLLYMRLGLYDEAVRVFDRGLLLTESDPKKARLSGRLIVSLLRQGKIPSADVRIDVFNQSYRSIPDFRKYAAEFLVERGKAYSAQMDFESASRDLDEVIRKYRETPFVPEAELEKGRIYLITNRDDDALEILTALPDRYPGHPILAKVYLNLGDYYFQNRQFENAMLAFKRIIEGEHLEEILPSAIKYLLRTYDTMGMWDAALALTRDYLRRFPEAEDWLSKRVQLGTYYMKLNEYNRALEVFRDVKRDANAETEAEIQYWIGECYYSMGQFEQAVFEYLKVEYLSEPTKLPWSTTALFQAGQAYLRMEKPEQARKLFEKVVTKEGATSDWGRIARARIDEIDDGKWSEESE